MTYISYMNNKKLRSQSFYYNSLISNYTRIAIPLKFKGAQAMISKLLKINLNHIAMCGMESLEASNILALKVLF